MAQIAVKITDLPRTVTQARLQQVLSEAGRVVSMKLISGGYSAVLDSPSIAAKLEKSTAGAIGLISAVSMDSSGLGELQGAVIQLVR